MAPGVLSFPDWQAYWFHSLQCTLSQSAHLAYTFYRLLENGMLAMV